MASPMRFARNSTIGIKQKICISCGQPCEWFSKKRCQQCARVEDTQKRMQAETDNIIRAEDLSELITEADAIVSRFIRLSAADEHGLVKCFTCPAIKHWGMMDAGHFIKRGHLFLRWDVARNLRPQCKDCNQFKGGQTAKFRENLNRDHPGLPDILIEESILVYKPTRDEIRNIISEYRPRVNQLLQKLK